MNAATSEFQKKLKGLNSRPLFLAVPFVMIPLELTVYNNSKRPFGCKQKYEVRYLQTVPKLPKPSCLLLTITSLLFIKGMGL
jgi:hypothetical protein